MPILALATTVLGLLPQLIAAGTDVMELFNNAKAVVDDNQHGPDAAAWAALDAKVKELQAVVRDKSRDVPTV